MDELWLPINLKPSARICEVSSDTRLRQSDAHNDRERQGKKRHKNGENDKEEAAREEEKVHSLDLLA